MNFEKLEQALLQNSEITEKALGGLTAGQHLKLRIEKAAMNPKPQRRPVSAWVPALACALVLAIALGVVAILLHKTVKVELESNEDAKV